MNKDFPQTEKQQRIYDFWKIRGWENVSAVLGNLSVHFHQKDRYVQNGLDYIYLEQFYHQAQLDVLEMMQKIIDSEKKRCGEANAFTCWVELKKQIIKQAEVEIDDKKS